MRTPGSAIQSVVCWLLSGFALLWIEGEFLRLSLMLVGACSTLPGSPLQALRDAVSPLLYSQDLVALLLFLSYGDRCPIRALRFPE